MADNKLKVDNGGNNYGSISLGQKAPKEGNMKFFDQLRSRLNYKKLQEENAPKQKTMSVFSLVSGLDRIIFNIHFNGILKHIKLSKI